MSSLKFLSIASMFSVGAMPIHFFSRVASAVLLLARSLFVRASSCAVLALLACSSYNR